MISLSRKETAQMLIDCSILFSRAQSFPNRKLKDLYNEMIIEKKVKGIDINNYTDNSYFVMMRVYYILNYLKLFSYYEENFFDSIDNGNIEFSKLKKNINDGGIFVEGNGNNFSNKNIILYIRNAFNHNDDPEHSKFNISKNGKYIEVNIKDVRTDKEKIQKPNDKRPFHIKIKFNDFDKMFSDVKIAIENLFIHYDNTDFIDNVVKNNEIDLENIKIVRILLPKKVDSIVLDEIEKLCNNYQINKKEKINQVTNILTNKNINFRIVEYELDEYQKRGIKKILSSENIQTLNGINSILLSQIINNYIPLGMVKTENIKNELIILKLLCEYDVTFKEMELLAERLLTLKFNELNEMERNIYNQLNSNKYYIINFINTLTFYIKKSSHITYLTYLFNNLYKDQELVINDKIIDKNHIRNSLTHGWFFISQDNQIEMYDNYNRKRNEYDFYWHESLNLIELLNIAYSVEQSYITAISNKRK